MFEHPAEDDPRLMYADYLDEQAGELPGRDPAEMRARAEFIRVQCEIGRLRGLRAVLHAANGGIEGVRKLGVTMRQVIHDSSPHPVFEEDRSLVRSINTLGDRESALLSQWEPTWRRAGECPECEGKGYFGSLRHSTGHEACFYSGDTGGLLRTFQYHHDDYDHAGPSEPVRVRFRRGWLDAVEVPRLEDVLGSDVWMQTGEVEWQPTPWARALRAHRSLTRVVVGELEPDGPNGGESELLAGNTTFDWWPEDVVTRVEGQRDADRLPNPILRKLLQRFPRQITIGGRGVEFATREAAVDALAVAVWEVVRG